VELILLYVTVTLKMTVKQMLLYKNVSDCIVPQKCAWLTVVSSILCATGKLKQTATSFPVTERKSSLCDCQME